MTMQRIHEIEQAGKTVRQRLHNYQPENPFAHLHSEVAKQAKVRQESMEKIVSADDLYRVVASVVKYYPELKIAQSIGYDGNVTVWCWHSVDSFSQLSDLFKGLANYGIRKDRDRPAVLPHDGSTYGHFYFTDGELALTVTASIDTTSKGSCKLVKVDSKTVITPVYELQCPDNNLEVE